MMKWFALVYFIIGCQFIFIYLKSDKVKKVNGNEYVFFVFVLIMWLPYVIFTQLKKWW